MQNIHSAELRQVQEQYLDTANILDPVDSYFVNISEDDDDFVVEDMGIKPAPPDEREAFLARFPSKWSWDTIKHIIIIGWRKGLYPANDAINWLVICGFIKPAMRANLDLWMENYALHELGAEGLPETFEAVEGGTS